MKLFTTSALTAVICLEMTAAKAQVFIPCLDLRATINAQVPDLVDENGILNGSDPGIAQIETLTLSLTSPGSVVDLTGIDQLYGLTRLTVSITQDNIADTLRITEFPTALERLVLFGNNEVVELGPIPADMVYLSLSQMSPLLGSGGILHVESFPDHLEGLHIENLFEVTWNDTARVDFFIFQHQLSGGLSNITLPSISASSTRIDLFCASLDMTNLETRQLFMGEFFAMNAVTWPEQIEFLHCNMTQFPISSGWPEQLDTLAVDSYMECMPLLPNSLSHLYLGNVWNENCIPNWPVSLPYIFLAGAIITNEQATYCSVLNSTCPGAHPGVAGRVFIDLNGNDVFDMGEPGLPQASVTLQPNGNAVNCQPNGTWEIGVAPGNYTITAASNYPYVLSTAPAEHWANVLNMGDTDTDNDFAVTLIPGIQDLRVHLYADPARPGFDNQVYLRCENYGTTAVDATVTFTFDADQTWLGSTVVPTSTAGNIATWSFPATPVGAVHDIVVQLNTAASVPLGTEIVHILSADPIATDETPLDNVHAFNDSVVGSYDPNDKLLSPAVLTPDEVTLGETPI
ncbi:MAG TPA: hypothetical protein PL070_09895, partial [Flavobacteriales bacterium]|nr:hypothetical protein [Flavobacteriales bacterium]